MQKAYIDVAYFDFRKAFDSVSHAKLLHKLKAYGVTGNILNWVEAFLCNRTQKVVVNSSNSEIIRVPSGVPQGSVLGPLLFVIYINDVIDIFENPVTAKLFADDLKSYITLDPVSCNQDIYANPLLK